MADGFQRGGRIDLQPGDTNVPFRFQVTIATSSNRTDGALPFGSTVSSFTIGAHLTNSPVASTQFIVSKSVDGNDLVVRLAWTTQLNPGLYHMEFNVTCSVQSGATEFKRQFDFDRVYLKDR